VQLLQQLHPQPLLPLQLPLVSVLLVKLLPKALVGSNLVLGFASK
jgi:hypothetical protein